MAIARDINARLSPVAKSVADYAEGLEGERGRALLVQLAQHGRWLHLYLVEEQLGAAGNRPDVADKEYLQIVSTRTDAVVPFEFIYDYKTPADTATVCKHWKAGLKAGKCGATCDRTSRENVCPLGFWGIRKVIERHALTPELAQQGRELYLQSEPSRASETLHLGGSGLFGASARVPAASLALLTAALNQRTGVKPGQAKDWDNWVKLVNESHPNLLVALAHTDGNGANVSLELGGELGPDVGLVVIEIHDEQRHERIRSASAAVTEAPLFPPAPRAFVVAPGSGPTSFAASGNVFPRLHAARPNALKVNNINTGLFMGVLGGSEVAGR
ncbi:MAG: hypothetical protein HC872_02535 [Gammaproteobacteria bacterium]|nr:hypothetical protein [Gammaproteobacteria bacterium]